MSRSEYIMSVAYIPWASSLKTPGVDESQKSEAHHSNALIAYLFRTNGKGGKAVYFNSGERDKEI